MYYLQSRYYDPAVGRFVNSDNYASTGQGIIGYNMFAYCGNNPISEYDPTGQATWSALLIGAVIGSIVSALSTWATGGSGKEIAFSAIIGATLGAMAAVKRLAVLTICIDVVITIVSTWRSGASVESGLMAGLVKLIPLGDVPEVGDALTDFISKLVFGTGKELVSTGTMELVVTAGDHIFMDNSISEATMYLSAVGGGPKNVVNILR